MISVFTPSHDPRWLDDCYESLCAQTLTEWEWVVVLNRGARWTPADAGDSRIKVYVLDQLRGVGACKSFAVERAHGDILVELDHDDYLRPDALDTIATTFAGHSEAALVYSDFTQVRDDLSPDGAPFDSSFGWEYQPQRLRVGDTEAHYIRVRALDASLPHNNGLIWFAPNHVRAFRRDAYEKAGGYDIDLEVLDDQDLMCRLYLQGEFVRIEECLYLQRVGEHNTQRQQALNAHIQEHTWEFYERYIGPMVEAWCERQGLGCLDISEAEDPLALVSALDTDSCGGIRIIGALEREPYKVALFDELHRVLVHGGMVLSMTASADSRAAVADPRCTSFWNEETFWSLMDERWQASRMRTFCPSDWYMQRGLAFVQANLIALKDGPRLGGRLGRT